MKTILNGIARSMYAVFAISLTLIVSLTSVFMFQVADAVGVVLEPRSITMSDSTPGATGVKYLVSIKPTTTEQELIVDFCSDTPIVGATCAYSNATVPVVGSATSSAGAITFPGSVNHTIRVTGLTMTGGSTYTITFSNITNPTQSCASTVCTFYARIITYATGNSSGYIPAASSGGTTTLGTYQDYGGAALSTVQVLSLTATVMESLTFCDSNATITTCATTGAPTITLGHGTPNVLTSTAVDGNYVYTQASTNAIGGVNVALKTTSSTTCGGLSSNGGGTCPIPSVNTGGSAPAATAITAGTAAVGLCVQPGAGVTATAPYNGTCTGTFATDTYGFNDSTSGSGAPAWNTVDLFSTYGSPIYSSAGALNAINNKLEFAATASATTPPAVYTANYVLVATGTF